MKRLSTHSAGKAIRLGRVFALAACLLAVCISQVVANVKKVKAGYKDYYDVCVNEAIQATPNMDIRSHIFFRAAVQETFSSKDLMDDDLMSKYIDNLLLNIQDTSKHPDGLKSPEVDIIGFKYLEILLTKTITDVTSEDFSETVAGKWKQLRAAHGGFCDVYLHPEDIPGCHLTNSNSRKIFKEIVTQTLDREQPMGKYIDELRKNSQTSEAPDDETRCDVETLIANYVDFLEVMTKYDFVLGEFLKIFDNAEDNDELTGSPQPSEAQASSATAKSVFAGYKNYYDISVDEAIQATPDMDIWSHLFFRAAVQETFSSKDLMDNYIDSLLSNTEDTRKLPDGLRIAEVGKICHKYLEILLTKTVTDLTGKDFSEFMAEKRKQLEANYGNFCDVYLRPLDIPGCHLTSPDSHIIFKRIVTKILDRQQPMTTYIKDLRKIIRNLTALNDKIRWDVETLLANYIDYLENMTNYDLVLTEYLNISNDAEDEDEPTGSTEHPSKKRRI